MKLDTRVAIEESYKGVVDEIVVWKNNNSFLKGSYDLKHFLYPRIYGI